MGDITDKDRDFFAELANRPADVVEEESTTEDTTKEIVIKGIKEEKGPEMPDWYRPHMKTRVGWLNGIPQRPITKEDRRKGKWKDVPQY